MQYKWIQYSDSSNLIMFFHGWSMTPSTISHLTDQNDILVFYRYSSLSIKPELLEKIHSYKSIHAVGWSFGVWVMALMLREVKNIARTIAINGTLSPVDMHYGIHPVIFKKTLKGLSEDSLKMFYRNMFAKDEEFHRFISCFEQVSLIESKKELSWFNEAFRKSSIDKDCFLPDTVIISKFDRIIPYRSQYRFWEGHPHLVILEEGHFPFYRFSSWGELFSL